MSSISNDVLGDQPKHFADCCLGLSGPLVQAIVKRLPRSPAMVLSIGSGSGLLESLLLQHASAASLDLSGVEVPTCNNKYLAADRLLRVPSTASLYPDAMLASALLFVYPRHVGLIAKYLDTCLNGALETVLWLGHRNDWPETEDLFSSAFSRMEYYEGPGMMEYEMLVTATEAKSYARCLPDGLTSNSEEFNPV